MIPESVHPTIRRLWPHVRLRADRPQAVLALATAWIEYGLDLNDSQLLHVTAHVQTALRALALPRLALAARHVGLDNVIKAGRRVPDVAETQRFVRDGMAVFLWLNAHLDCILASDFHPLSPPALAESPTRSHLIVPVPGATRTSNGIYALDSGLDILVRPGTPVQAAAAGTVVRCTVDTVWIALDEPLQYGRATYPLTCYRYLSRLDCHCRLHVERGAPLGETGIRPGGRVPYLHFGVVSDMHESDFIRPFRLAALFGWV